MAAQVLNIGEITIDPAVRGGQPVIAGTSIRVTDIAAYHISGDKLTPEQLAKAFQLDLGQIYAALAYFYLNQDVMEEVIRMHDADAEWNIDLLEKEGRVIRFE